MRIHLPQKQMTEGTLLQNDTGRYFSDANKKQVNKWSGAHGARDTVRPNGQEKTYKDKKKKRLWMETSDIDWVLGVIH